MSSLAAWQRVVYVDYPFTWKDVFLALRKKKKHVPLSRIFSRRRVKTVKSRQGHPVDLLTLWPALPVNGLSDGWLYRLFMWVNAQMMVWQIKQAMNNLGITQPVVLNAFQPALGNIMIGKLGERKWIYYCYDEISAAKWAGKHGSREEKAMMQKADLVLVSSPGLYEIKKSEAKQIAKVYNGVDFDLFYQAFRPELPQRLVVGYVGTLDDRMDMALCEQLFGDMPQVEFQFVGRVIHEKILNWPKIFPNVKLMGSFSTNELPFLMSEFSVGIIPFVENEFTRAIYPLKINEYLAAGIPVVSTQFTDLQEFADVAYLSSSAGEFNGYVLACLMHPDEEMRSKGIAHARQCDWKARAKQLQAHLTY